MKQLSLVGHMENITNRQKSILAFIRECKKVANKEIRAHITRVFGDISRVTIVRDIEVLVARGLIRKIGRGRSTAYEEAVKTPLLQYVDADDYFTKGPDERTAAFPHFNFAVFDGLKHLVGVEEDAVLEKTNARYAEGVRSMTGTALKKEIERLTIELSWKSSHIEGNTYSLIDTEILIKEHREAAGHKKEEAVMILNHKNALDYIFASKANFKVLRVSHIERIHDLVAGGLNISRGIRKKAVGITGTTYRPLDNEHQIREALENAAVCISALASPFAKALAAVLLVSYIQPFEDGNKRTARLLGNAILLAHGACPLSYRSVDEVEYKKAVILFYEQNNASLFKKLFLEQFAFAVEHYFLA